MLLLLEADLLQSNNQFSNISHGYKIAGVHWLMTKDTHLNRATEIASGIISPKLNLKLPELKLNYLIEVNIVFSIR